MVLWVNTNKHEDLDSNTENIFYIDQLSVVSCACNLYLVDGRESQEYGWGSLTTRPQPHSRVNERSCLKELR